MNRSPLLDLTAKYFTRRGYKIKKDTGGGEASSNPRIFDLLVTKAKEQHPVWVKDWDRTVGVNIVINVDKALKRTGLSGPILVADKFSEHAKSYANRRGIKLITKSEMRREIKLV